MLEEEEEGEVLLTAYNKWSIVIHVMPAFMILPVVTYRISRGQLGRHESSLLALPPRHSVSMSRRVEDRWRVVGAVSKWPGFCQTVFKQSSNSLQTVFKHVTKQSLCSG